MQFREGRKKVIAYRGLDYNSEEEARWAVFMDTLKIDFVYRAKTHQLSSGPLTPAFKLQQSGTLIFLTDGFVNDELVNRGCELARLTDSFVLLAAFSILSVEAETPGTVYWCSPKGHYDRHIGLVAEGSGSQHALVPRQSEQSDPNCEQVSTAWSLARDYVFPVPETTRRVRREPHEPRYEAQQKPPRQEPIQVEPFQNELKHLNMLAKDMLGGWWELANEYEEQQKDFEEAVDLLSKFNGIDTIIHVLGLLRHMDVMLDRGETSGSLHKSRIEYQGRLWEGIGFSSPWYAFFLDELAHWDAPGSMVVIPNFEDELGQRYDITIFVLGLQKGVTEWIPWKLLKLGDAELSGDPKIWFKRLILNDRAEHLRPDLPADHDFATDPADYPLLQTINMEERLSQ